jgi:hypothetical protein
MTERELVKHYFDETYESKDFYIKDIIEVSKKNFGTCEDLYLLYDEELKKYSFKNSLDTIKELISVIEVDLYYAHCPKCKTIHMYAIVTKNMKKRYFKILLK